MLSKEELLDLGAKKAIHHQNEGCITSPVIENARTRWAAIDYEKGWKDCAFTFWPEIERLRKAYEDIYSHNARLLNTPELVQVKKLTEKVADLEKENERLKLYQYTIECEAQHNKNLHEEELFNSDNLLKRLNEKKAKVADLEKENERLKEAIGYLVKVPTQSYEKELARKLTDLERKLAVAKEALGFYAAESNWDECPLGNPYNSYIAMTEAGKKARAALKELGKK